MADKIQIPLRGEDYHRCTTIRTNAKTLDALDSIASKSNRSRNDIINIMLEYCINHAVIVDTQQENPL